MKRILHIISSVKGAQSFSNKLSDAILERLVHEYPESEIVTHNLTKTPFPHLEESHIAAFFTPVENHNDENKAAIRHSNQAIKEVQNADIIVIGVPLYNFGIPSTLKAWIDHIARSGITFTYALGYPEGLLVNKKVYLAIASGSIFSEGPMMGYDFSEPYLRTALGFLGMRDITAFRVEGIALPDTAATALPKALDSVLAFDFKYV